MKNINFHNATHNRYPRLATVVPQVAALIAVSPEGFTAQITTDGAHLVPVGSTDPTTGGNLYAIGVKGYEVRETDHQQAALLAVCNALEEGYDDQPAMYVGGWFDKSTGEYVLDVVRLVAISQGEAIDYGVANDQKAIFNLTTGEEFKCPKAEEPSVAPSPNEVALALMYIQQEVQKGNPEAIAGVVALADQLEGATA